MNNKERFLQLVSSNDTNTIDEVKQRIKNRAMLRESQNIAIKVLTKLDELGWTQRDLANAMEVSPQQVSKIVSGKENLTIDTQIKLQNILHIPILASYYEKKIDGLEAFIYTTEKWIERVEAQSYPLSSNYQATVKTTSTKPTGFVESYQLVG